MPSARLGGLTVPNRSSASSAVSRQRPSEFTASALEFAMCRYVTVAAARVATRVATRDFVPVGRFCCKSAGALSAGIQKSKVITPRQSTHNARQ